MKVHESGSRTNVFISYSHQDKRWLERLRRHLKPLERDYAIEFWDDTKIEAGAKWREEIEKALQSAQVALLLISADFLASEFITSNELPSLLAAADKEGATILPVIVSPCRFLHTKSLSQFQAVNPPTKPLINMSRGEQESLFVKLTEEIEAALGPQKSRPTPADARGRTARKKAPEEASQGVRADREEEKAETPPVLESAPPKKAETNSQVQRPSPAAVTPSRAEIPFSAIHKLEGHGRQVTCLAFSPDGAILASASGGGFFTNDGEVRLWRVSDGKFLRVLKHPQFVHSVTFSPDGATLSSGSRDEIIRLWRVSDGELLRTLEGLEEAGCTIVFSPDGATWASGAGSHDITVRLWRTSDGKPIRVLKENNEAVTSIAFSPDGAMLVVGTSLGRISDSGDDPVLLWRVADGELLRTFGGHTKHVRAVAFSPDGAMVASASDDQTVRLWRVSDGKHVGTLRGQTEKVQGVAFSPDGTILVSRSSNDKAVRLWSVPDGKPLGMLEGHEKPVTRVAFSPDGAMLASGSEDKTVRLWKMK